MESRRYKITDGIDRFKMMDDVLRDLNEDLSHLVIAKDELLKGHFHVKYSEIAQKLERVMKTCEINRGLVIDLDIETSIIQEYFENELVFGSQYAITTSRLEEHYRAWANKTDHPTSVSILRSSLIKRGVFARRCSDPFVYGRPKAGKRGSATCGKPQLKTYFIHVDVKPIESIKT